MLSEFDPARSDTFIEVARSRSMLSDDQAKALAEISRQKSVMASRIAVENGMLKPVEVEIVEAFLEPKDLAPGYELLDVVGYGALGVVYRARQSHLDRDVAIKAILQSRVFQQNVVARFQQEGALIGRLHHPNIVSAFDFGSHRDRLYLVMELVSGVDLSRRLDESPMPLLNALSVLRQTAAGLSHAFSHRIVHRDIKPGNLLLTDAPAGFDLPPGVPLVKIADFGLARFHRAPELDEEDTRLTMTGAALGTPMYCAPEQLSGDDVDHRADIYALGATFFRMLSGETPFAAERVSRLIAAKVTGQPPRMDLLPSDLNPAVRELLTDMMKTEPDERIADYEILIDRIDAIGSPRLLTVADRFGKRGKQPPDAAAAKTSTRLWVSRRGWWVGLLGLLLVGLGAIWLARLLNGNAKPTMLPSGWEAPLFDGRTMTGWIVRGGLWNSGLDKEGGAILVGRGLAGRSLPTPPSTDTNRDTGIGFRVGIDLQQAKSAEVHFAFRGEWKPETQRMVVKLSAQEAVLGTKDHVDSELDLREPGLTIHSDESDQPRYDEVRVERHGARWFAFFNDRAIGSLPASRGDNEQLVQLVADGSVHFEGPLVYQLTQPAASVQ